MMILIFYQQASPWFVSDATKADIEWVIDSMIDNGCKTVKKVKYKILMNYLVQINMVIVFVWILLTI